MEAGATVPRRVILDRLGDFKIQSNALVWWTPFFNLLYSTKLELYSMDENNGSLRGK